MTDAKRYAVTVEDYYRYGEEDRRYTHSAYDTADDAIAAAKKIIDDSLKHELQQSPPGVTARELYDRYIDFGSDPFIKVPPGAPRIEFSTLKYAKQKAIEMCNLAGNMVSEDAGK